MEPETGMKHKPKCYEPTYDERPTITFKEVWGKHAWLVEYYGKYDNKREPHVKLRYDYDAPDQHIYKVRQGDVYSLHNLRKGGKDNQAVLWDVQGLILSNGKEAHFTVHHGQRHEKEFMSTKEECLQTKAEELRKRLESSSINKTAREKAAKEKAEKAKEESRMTEEAKEKEEQQYNIQRENAARLREQYRKHMIEKETKQQEQRRLKEEECRAKEEADAQKREQEEGNETLPGTQSVLNERTNICKLCNNTNFANTIQCKQCGTILTKKQDTKEDSNMKKEQWELKNLDNDENQEENENNENTESQQAASSSKELLDEDNQSHSLPSSITTIESTPGKSIQPVKCTALEQETKTQGAKQTKKKRKHKFRREDGTKKTWQFAYVKKKANKMAGNARKFGFYGYNGKEQGTADHPHKLRVIANEEECGSVEERFNADSWFREMKLQEKPPFTAHCARIIDVISSTTKEELTEASGITGDGIITHRITHTAMAAKQPAEVNLNSPASETTANRKKRKQWREMQNPDTKKYCVSILDEIRRHTEKDYKPKPIEPDSQIWEKRKTLTAGSNEQDTTTNKDNHSPPCFQSFQDDRSHGQRGRLFTKSRSRSPVRDAAVPLELGDTQVRQLEPGDTQAMILEPGDTQADAIGLWELDEQEDAGDTVYQ